MEAAALMQSLLRSHAPHCSHHDGHVVAATVCGRHECSLANYGLACQHDANRLWRRFTAS